MIKKILFLIFTVLIFTITTAGCTVTRVDTEKKAVAKTVESTESGAKAETTEAVRKKHSEARKARDEESGGPRHRSTNASIEFYLGAEKGSPLTSLELDELEQVSVKAYRGFRGYPLAEILKVKGVTSAKTVEVRGTGEKSGQAFQLLKWEDIVDPDNSLVLASQSNGNLKLIGSGILSGKDEQVQDVIRITVIK